MSVAAGSTCAFSPDWIAAGAAALDRVELACGVDITLPDAARDHPGIGTEIAAALSLNGVTVTLVTSDDVADALDDE